MEKRWKRITALLLCGCLCLGGCSSAPKTEGTGSRFHQLPLGSVSAEGWLLDQLNLQKDNLTGVFEELSLDAYPGIYDQASGKYVEDPSSDKKVSGWISEGGYLGENDFNEERVPYYVRGLVSLAYTLNDDSLKEQAQKWIDWSIESQADSGAFGPKANNEAKIYWWSLMVMAQAIEDYYDGLTLAGGKDDRVIPFLTKFFEYQRKAVKKKEMTEWSAARGGDNIQIVYWLYEKTGEDWLKEFCGELYAQTLDWEKVYAKADWGGDTYYTKHGVNIQESLKLMPLMYQVTGETSYLEHYWEGVESIYMTSGRIDGMSNADEAAADISAVRGSETCAAAERIYADGLSLAILSDPLIGDHLEQVAYNAWPSQLTPGITGQTYFTQQNQVEVSLGVHGFSLDGGERLLYGTPGGYPCCINDCQMGWPKFVSSMWMGTEDNGLAVAAYGPNTVKTELGGKQVSITQETNYPFEDTVKLTIHAQGSANFPLYLRIPSWCENAAVTVNGESAGEAKAAHYLKVSRGWKDGDTVELTFPMEIKPVNMQNNSVSVTRGPLVYALAVEEDWVPLKDSFKEQHFSGSYQLPAWDYNLGLWDSAAFGEQYATHEIYADSDWNYALNLSNPNFSDNFKVETDRNALTGSEPFTFSPENAPVKLTVSGKKVDDWDYDTTYAGANAGTVPQSPVEADGKEESLTLIPYAFTRLRISLFPWIAGGYDGSVYEPVSYHYDDSRILFNTVTGVNKLDVRYALEFAYSAEKDQVLQLWINNEQKGELQFTKGENTVTAENVVLDHTRYNKIELKSQDGAAVSGISVKTMTAKPGEELACAYYWPGDDNVKLEDSTISPNKMQIVSYTDENGEKRNFIGGIDDVGDMVTYTVNAKEAGTYKMCVMYATYDTDEEHTYSHSVLVNGQSQGSKIKYPFNCLWNQFSEDTFATYFVKLQAGENTIQLKKTDPSDGYVQIAAMILGNTPVAAGE